MPKYRPNPQSDSSLNVGIVVTHQSSSGKAGALARCLSQHFGPVSEDGSDQEAPQDSGDFAAGLALEAQASPYKGFYPEKKICRQVDFVRSDGKPSKVVADFLRGLKEKDPKFTHSYWGDRFHPVDYATKPYRDRFERLVDQHLETALREAFDGEDLPVKAGWAIKVFRRASTQLDRPTLLEVIGQRVGQLPLDLQPETVSFENPDWVFLVEVNPRFVGFAIVRHWQSLGGYSMNGMTALEADS